MSEIAMFKIENGKAKGLDAKGIFVKYVGDAGVTDARIQGDAITINYANGKIKMYDKKGVFKKNL